MILRWKMRVASENRALSPGMQPRAGRVIDDALAIVHYIEFYGFVLKPRDTHRVGIRLNVLPIVFAIIPPSRMGIDGALLTKSHQ